MNVLFHNTGQSFSLLSSFRKTDVYIADRVPLERREPELISTIDSFSEVEQLQGQVLNSLIYASGQNVLPSTLPEQLNVKFLNTSTLDKIIDRIIPSPIAQLEDSNTMYISTNLLPQNQLNYINNSFIYHIIMKLD